MKTIKQISEAKSNFAKVGLEIKEQEKLWFDFWKSSKNRKAFQKQIEEHIEYDVERHYKKSDDPYSLNERLDDIEVADKGIAYNASLESDTEEFDDVTLSAYGYDGKNKNVGVSYTKSPADKVEERQMRYSTTKSKVLKNIMTQIIKMGNNAAEDIPEYDNDNGDPMTDREFHSWANPNLGR